MEIGWTKENIFVYLPALIGSLLWEGLARSAEVAGQEWNEGRGDTKIKKKKKKKRRREGKRKKKDFILQIDSVLEHSFSASQEINNFISAFTSCSHTA